MFFALLFNHGQALRQDQAACRVEPKTHHEALRRGATRAFWLDHVDVFEDLLHHLVKVAEVLHLEELGAEGPSLIEHLGSDGQCGLQQLRLHVLVDLVEACHVRRAVTHD